MIPWESRLRKKLTEEFMGYDDVERVVVSIGPSVVEMDIYPRAEGRSDRLSDEVTGQHLEAIYKAIQKGEHALVMRALPDWFLKEGIPPIGSSKRGSHVTVTIPLPAKFRRTTGLAGLLTESPPDIKGPSFIVGEDPQGRVFWLRFSSSNPHALIVGATGSGKTVLMRSLLIQASWRKQRDVVVVLSSGKLGEGLVGLDKGYTSLFPISTEPEEHLAVARWVLKTMQERYREEKERVSNGRRKQGRREPPALLWFFDEFNVAKGQPEVAEIIATILAQGRAAGVHFIGSTQNATVENLGKVLGQARSNFTSHIILRVDARRTGLDVSIPSNTLGGRGDAYLVHDSIAYRVQVASPNGVDLKLGGPLKELPACSAAEPGEMEAIALQMARMGRVSRDSLARELRRRGFKIGSTRAQELADWANSVVMGEAQ